MGSPCAANATPDTLSNAPIARADDIMVLDFMKESCLSGLPPVTQYCVTQLASGTEEARHWPSAFARASTFIVIGGRIGDDILSGDATPSRDLSWKFDEWSGIMR